MSRLLEKICSRVIGVGDLRFHVGTPGVFPGSGFCWLLVQIGLLYSDSIFALLLSPAFI